MLRFPYQDELLTGPPPPSLPAAATVRWHPLVPVDILGPTGVFRRFGRAVLDPASDDTVLPHDTATKLGVVLHADAGHRLRWRGQVYPLRFGDVELVLEDGVSEYQWRAVAAFSPAPIRYPILGTCRCLEFFDARFLGADRIVELEVNRSYAGTIT
jgi:hypothetical protein